MKETGILNQDIARIISQMGHTEEIVIADAGLKQPKGVEVIDLSLEKNVPTVLNVLEVLKKHFSVEKIICATEGLKMSPSRIDAIKNNYWPDAMFEAIPQVELRERSKKAIAIIKTADFTAVSNVILVSGPGERWFKEVD